MDEPFRYVQIPERSQKIAEMREAGKTFREIGNEFGISIERTRQIYKSYCAIKKFNKRIDDIPDTDFVKCLYKAQQTLGYSPSIVTRTYNCLARSGILQSDDTLADIFERYSDEQLLQVRNFGTNSLTLLHKASDILKQHQ